MGETRSRDEDSCGKKRLRASRGAGDRVVLVEKGLAVNPQAVTSDGLADRVEARRADILRRWEARVRVLLGASPPPQHVGLPRLMDALLAALRDPDAFEAVEAFTREQGRSRSRAGADAAVLVREYGLLRDVVLDVLEEEHRVVDVAAFRVLSRAIDTSLAHAVARTLDNELPEPGLARGDLARRIEEAKVAADELLETRRAQRERDEAREQLTRVLTHLPIVLWAMDTRGVMTLFEGEGVRSVGMDPHSLLGCSIFDIFQGREDVREASLRALAGESFTAELKLFDVWFEVRFSPVRGLNGNVTSVSGLSVDITDRRRAEEELRASETRYRLATQATRDVIWDWDPVSGIMRWSELAPRVFRIADGGSVPANLDWWTSRIHPDERERISQGFRAVLDGGGEDWNAEYRFLRGDGTWAVIEDRGRLVRDARGQPVRMVGALQDITERRAAEEEAKRRAGFEQLLIGIVGHDLRNPISAITMAAGTLERQDQLDERGRKAVARIRSSAARASRMLRDVLDFTQARLGGGIRMEPRPVDLHDLVRQVMDEVQLAHPTRRLHVECLGDGHGVWDADRLAQVITNLVNNALSYGYPQCPVFVRTRGEAQSVVLSVHNQGPPIPSELMPHLFEPLKRAGGAQGPSQGHGLGLGLFIVKHVVDAHGGSVRVRSTEREGTSFRVALPRRLDSGLPAGPWLAPDCEPG
ncbi:PAS domain S-box protein [Myxococcaceae bacterium JPH2]|nr:PAS domain S-box protein [Myxococcaceae bacterium JPH2]